MAEEQRIINRHLLAEVLKICHISEIEVDQVKIPNAKIALADITNRVQDTYNTNERWVVKKMKLEYGNKIVVICPLYIKKIMCNILATNML